MRLGTSLDELVDPVALLYRDFLLAPEDELHDFEVRVDPVFGPVGRTLRRARALIDGRPAFDPFKYAHALPVFEWAINWCTFTRPNQYLLLHSGVVERGGLALLLSGKPGAGKSTLTAGLLFRGWRLFSDEVCVIPPGSTDALPLPRPVSLKNASIEIVAGLSADAVLGPSAHGTRKGTVAHLRPPTESVVRACERATPRWVIFPTFEAGASTTLTRITRGEALQRLGNESFNYSVLGSVGFETLAAVVEHCDCCKLRFGDLDEALRKIEELSSEDAARRSGGGRDTHQTAVAHTASATSTEPSTSGASNSRTLPGGVVPGKRSLEILQRPGMALSLTTAEWGGVISACRHTGLLSRLALLVDDEGLMEQLPEKVRQLLDASRPQAMHHERTVRWEVSRISEALNGLKTKVVLLKGAAYVVAGLPAARGRLVSDVDVLVPRDDLHAVERALLDAGWKAIKLHPYDQRFYRQWSHELPPLEHWRRKSVVDVHHNILPLTGRLQPDPEKLMNASVSIDGHDGLWMLCPEDMVLHTAVHLFQDGELGGMVRDLVDADALIRDFAARDSGFWDRLAARGFELGLERPLYYTVRYASRMLGTPVPPAAHAAISRARPVAPVRKAMDLLVGRALFPAWSGSMSRGEDAARLLLYVRAHWLRMPPWMLATHLFRKALRRFSNEEDSE